MKFKEWINQFPKLEESWNSLPEPNKTWFETQIFAYAQEEVKNSFSNSLSCSLLSPIEKKTQVCVCKGTGYYWDIDGKQQICNKHDYKIYHRGKELDYETAKKVMDEFPEEDDYVQTHYNQFLTNGEHNDNTVETSNYWNKCKKIVGRKQ